ncbi:MAG: MFS transporter [Richelia sp.]|nr:MFS transporter [Richelia sp.]
MLPSTPMMVNLLQPLRDYISERMTSRHSYCFWTHGAARLLWLILASAIFVSNGSGVSVRQMVWLTLAIILASHLVTALGSASWLSWMAMLVPRRLRGRYFGIRNSLSSFTDFLFMPLAGLLVSLYPGGTMKGYGVVLGLGIIAGLVSLAFQFIKVDINPQQQNNVSVPSDNTRETLDVGNRGIVGGCERKTYQLWETIWKDTNFLIIFTLFWFVDVWF